MAGRTDNFIECVDFKLLDGEISLKKVWNGDVEE